MSSEVAKGADKAFFESLNKGERVTLYLTNKDIPSFNWTHDRIEGDLVYGQIQFEGYGREFPSQAYLCDTGHSVFLCVRGFRPNPQSDEYVHINSPFIFQTKPHPSQFPGQHKPLRLSDLPEGSKLKENEYDVLNDALEKLRNAGFIVSDMWGLRQSRDLKISANKRQQPGCFDFDICSPDTKGRVNEDLVAHISIRKRKGKGFFKPPEWGFSMADDSKRSVQPDGGKSEGISITARSTQIMIGSDPVSAEEVASAILDGAAKLKSRNE